MILLQAHSLTNTGWFSIENAPMTLGEKDSTLSFEIGPEAPELTPGQWLMDDEDPGRGIVWRVRSVVDNYGTGMRTVTCEHIIQTLKDTSLFGEATTGTLAGNASAETCTALQAIQYALGRQTDWVMRAEDFGYANVSQPYSFNGENILQALETVCGTLEDCWWSYDLSVYPFRLKILPRNTAMACEMREGRNISSIKRTMDAGGMYTRIYPIGKNNLHITGDYISRNEDVYGVIMKVETDQSCETEGMLRAWADGRLRRHCQPNVSIQISGLDLSRETGEPLDKLQLGRACRVPLPEYQTNILENIVKMQWRDKKKEPENVTLTLSNTVADVASIVKQERSEGGGSSGRASRYGAKKAEEDHAWFVDTTDHVSMVAEAIVGHTEEAVNWSRVAELTVDGQGIHGHVTQAEQDIIANQAAIEINERNISLTVKSRQIPNDRLHGYASRAAFPATGASGHYYYYETGSGNDAKRYYFRWNGSEYIPAHVFTGLDGNLYGNYVNAGEIAVAVNEAGETEARINAQKVYLGTIESTDFGWLDDFAGDAKNRTGVFANYIYARKLTAEEVKAMFSEVDLADIAALSCDSIDTTGDIDVGGNVTVNSGDLSVNGDISMGGALQIDNFEDAPTTLEAHSLQINGEEQAIFLSTADVNFSKATSLSLAWSSGELTITGTPAQTPALEKKCKLATSYYPEGTGVTQCTANGNASSSGKYVKRGITVMYESGGTDPTGAPNTASTGRTLQVVLDASDVFDTGKKDAEVTMDPFELDTLPATTTVNDVQSRVITAKAHNSSNSNKKASKTTTLSLVQGTKCVYLKMDGTQIAKQTCTPETTTVTEYVEVPVYQTGSISSEYIDNSNNTMSGTYLSQTSVGLSQKRYAQFRVNCTCGATKVYYVKRID